MSEFKPHNEIFVPEALAEPVLLSHELENKETIKSRMTELARRKASGELDQDDYNHNDIYYALLADHPIERRDIGNKAIVFTVDQFMALEDIKFISAEDGQVITFDAESTAYHEPDDLIILFPEELGNL